MKRNPWCSLYYRSYLVNKGPDNRLKLTDPSVHAFCNIAGSEGLGPRGEKARPFGPQFNRSVSQILDGGEEKELLIIRHWRIVKNAFR